MGAKAALLVALCVVPHAALAQSGVDGRSIADETSGANWLSYGRTYSEQRFSPLQQVNTGNVEQLGLAWSIDLPGQRTLEATPLAVDGVLYFSGTFGKTFAVDARRGTLLWEFDPDLAHHSPEKLRIGMGAHRGVAFWRGKVYVGLTDGRLVALDAKTGSTVWSVQTFDEKARKSLSGAPRVFNGKVIIGHGGADYGTRGYVTAYDAQTGGQLWRFYTVPGDPKNGFENPAMRMAAATWDGEWWRWGGGGTVWDNITYDPKFNRVYLAVGNGSPWNASVRSPGNGDNLFLCSIVALDADSGRYVWHYQVNPRDSWDYDASQQMVLADLRIAGKRRAVLMQAPKNGFYYVIDRGSGKLLSAEKFAKVTWAQRIDLATGRPVEMNNLRYEKGAVEFSPSSAGAHNFQPMSFNPRTGLVYIPTMKMAMRIAAAHDDRNLQDFDNAHRQYFPVQASDSELIKLDPDDGTAGLLAWDPVAQKKRWEVHYADSFWNGGTMTTAGDLVFQGTGRGQFLAYDARSGRKLWSFDTGLGVIAAPATYTVDDVQYISLLVGYGGSAGNGTELFDYGWRFNEQPRRLLTFALHRHEPLPPTNPPRFALRAVDNPALAIDSTIAADGEKLYNSSCFLCHGAHLESTGSIAPDLRESRLALSWDSFTAVVHEGALAGVGMPKYADLTETDLNALYMYIRRTARDSLAAPH